MSEGRLAKILADHGTELAASLAGTVDFFYQALNEDPSSHRVLSVLSQPERQRLNQAQIDHLRLLIDPDVLPPTTEVGRRACG